MVKKLPAPRLQFVWKKSKGNPEYPMVAYYQMVLPLRDTDMRRESPNGKKGELVIDMGETLSSGNDPNTNNPPYRDGAHARWDSKALNNLPIYVITMKGKAWLLDTEAHEMIAVK